MTREISLIAWRVITASVCAAVVVTVVTVTWLRCSSRPKRVTPSNTGNADVKPIRCPAELEPIQNQPMRICVERIVPDEFLPNRKLFRESIRKNAGKQLNAEEVGDVAVARLAVVISKKWQAGSTLKCRFLDGSVTMHRKVETIAHEWETHGNIRFEFVQSGPAEIRISFYADPHLWSAVGTDALISQYFSLHQPTMNLGWLRDETDANEYSRVALHAFGHALGAIHEHGKQKFTRVWNEALVLQTFQGPPNYWTAKDIESNVLEKYSPHGLVATRFDPESIMLYVFDERLFRDGYGPTNTNTKPSKLDSALMRQMYPYR